MVWYNAYPGTINPDHSATITAVGLNPDGTADPTTTTFSSKDGGYTPVNNYTLAQLMAIYGNTYAVFRRR